MVVVDEAAGAEVEVHLEEDAAVALHTVLLPCTAVVAAAEAAMAARRTCLVAAGESTTSLN